MRAAGLAALIAFTSITPALAQDEGDIIVSARPLPDGAERRIVRVADLDLRTDAGVREMERRVGMAVKSICNKSGTSNVPLQERMLDKECSDGAWASARPQMNSAIVRARG